MKEIDYDQLMKNKLLLCLLSLSLSNEKNKFERFYNQIKFMLNRK